MITYMYVELMCSIIIIYLSVDLLRSTYIAHTVCTFSKVLWTSRRLGVLLSGLLRSRYSRSLVDGREMFSFCKSQALFYLEYTIAI